jgi:hypothetical protein
LGAVRDKKSSVVYSAHCLVVSDLLFKSKNQNLWDIYISHIKVKLLLKDVFTLHP